MAKKKKAKEQKVDLEKVLDSYESWLEGQRPKTVVAKHGFIADVKIEESA